MIGPICVLVLNGSKSANYVIIRVIIYEYTRLRKDHGIIMSRIGYLLLCYYLIIFVGSCRHGGIRVLAPSSWRSGSAHMHLY